MSYLFNRKHRPFSSISEKSTQNTVSSECSDADEEVAWEGMNPKGKSSKRRKVASDCSTSALPAGPTSLQASFSSSANMPKDSLNDVIELETSPAPKASAEIIIPAAASPLEMVDLDGEGDEGKEDPDFLHLKSLLNKVHDSKRKLTSQSAVVNILDSPTESLTSKDIGYYAPEVRSAAQRVQDAFSRSSTLTRQSTASSSAKYDQDKEQEEEREWVTVRTRLNGQHEHSWKMGLSDGFSKLLQRLSSLYGVSSDSLKLIFDGDKLSPEQTPQFLDFEDGDEFLVDVKIDAKLYQKAVAKAAEKDKQTNADAHTLQKAMVLENLETVWFLSVMRALLVLSSAC
eukprot:gene3300-3620_t